MAQLGMPENAVLLNGADPGSEDFTTEPGPVFILTASRSGSTLLRFILDSHPELACPPETMIGATSASLLRLFDSLEHFGAADRTDVQVPANVSADGLAVIRSAIDYAYGNYLKHSGKKRWCDKSLDTYQFADLIHKIYPEAKFICLVRHCMDVIASGARNCPWGVSRYGFDPFVAQHPGNTVAAIGAYWLACMQASLAFQDQNPGSCVLVRYEDLVTAPEDTVAGILRFIGASPAPGITRACFQVPHEARGPGDERIWFTDQVSASSMGLGASVPSLALPPQMRESINEVLARLRYKVIDDSWGSAFGHIDPRADAPGIPPGSNGGPQAAAGPQPVIAMLEDRLTSGLSTAGTRIASQWPSVAGVTVRLIAESPSGDHSELRWRFGGSKDVGTGNDLSSDANGVPVMIASQETWMSVLDGKANIIDEIVGGRLRCFNPNDTHRLRSDEVHAIGALLGLAKIPVAAWKGAPEQDQLRDS